MDLNGPVGFRMSNVVVLILVTWMRPHTAYPMLLFRVQWCRVQSLPSVTHRHRHRSLYQPQFPRRSRCLSPHPHQEVVPVDAQGKTLKIVCVLVPLIHSPHVSLLAAVLAVPALEATMAPASRI